ncbi:MAG TPA: 16S rRNA (guanine(527)-N(7))-methyltransferase RsmG [Solirubrobacteraceae bacterium]|nr:16S rRNA (guanine(527)-N(7))-methyltransferase RsmG [Solirubrobacteraceae bacterium]
MSARSAKRLEELRGAYGLSAAQGRQLEGLLELLAEDEQAPTTVREPVRAVDVHLADSLAALTIPAVRDAGRVADIGAGAGFPGLVLAVGLPRATVTLVESQARKCAFIDGALTRAAIENARVVCARAEEWPAVEGAGSQDIVTARALAPQPVVLEYAAPLLRAGGVLVDWRGARNEPEEAAARLAADQLGLQLSEIRHVEPFAAASNHHLHLYLKVRDTPARYPRRAGIARKRPLGS